MSVSCKKKSFAVVLKILICLPMYLQSLSCISAAERIPALGRICQLGSLYDARKDSFNGMNIFKSKLPNDLITTTQTPRVTMESQILKKESDKFKLFSVDLDTAASIHAQILKPQGAASVLRNGRITITDVTGMFIQTFQTAEQTFSLFYDELKNNYNTDFWLLKNATHVVTGIQWGGSIVITFTDTILNRPNIVQYRNILNQEFRKLTSTSRTNVNETSPFKMRSTSDVYLQNRLSTTLREVREQIDYVQQSIKSINSGLGVPLKITLTPISSFKKYLNISTNTDTVVHKLDQTFLRKCLNTIDSHMETGKALINIHENSNCISNKTHREFEMLQDIFRAENGNFELWFREMLLDFKSETVNNSSRFQVLQSDSSLNVRRALIFHEEELQKAEFCNQLKDLYPYQNHGVLFPTDDEYVLLQSQNYLQTTMLTVQDIKTVDVQGKYSWELYLNIDNSENDGTITREETYTSSLFTSRKSLLEETMETISKIDTSLGTDISIEVYNVNVKVGTSIEAVSKLQQTIEEQKEVREERSIVTTINVGARSKLTLYQLHFNAPGIFQKLETLSTTPLHLDDVIIGCSYSFKKFVSGFKIVYTTDAVSRPEDSVQELHGRDANINAGFGGNFVWLVPIWTTKVTEGITGLEVIVQYYSNPDYDDLAKGAGYWGYYRYLKKFRDPSSRDLITKVKLFRTPNANPSTSGWKYWTGDINDNRGGDNLYLCWETTTV